MTTIVEKISLYNQTGNSDKVYVVNLVEVSTGAYHVIGFNGRRGTSLTKQEKTQQPVAYGVAKDIYDKLVAKKKKDSYFEGEEINGLVVGNNSSGSSTNTNNSGLMPQLLNSIDIADAMKYINDDDFMAQEKKDGVRLMTKKSDGGVLGSNKRGMFTPVAKTIFDGLMQVQATKFVADGEAIGDHYYVFDLLEVEGDNLKRLSAKDRYMSLQERFADSEYVHVVETAFTREEKLALYTRIMDEGGEGLVFKRKSAAYTEGRPNSGGDQFKLKFVESASCVVMETTIGKRSVKFGLYDGANFVEYGKVTIPANQAIPSTSDIIEVRYLYAYRNGALFQPVYLGLRNDIAESECDVSQLKFKQEPMAA